MVVKVTGTFSPIRDGIVVRNMEFGEQQTTGGIIILSTDGKNTGIHPRWGEVVSVGPEQKDVHPGQYVLVAHGRWSRGFEVNGETMRTVDPKDVLGIQGEEPTEIWKPSLGHQTRAYEGTVGVGTLSV